MIRRCWSIITAGSGGANILVIDTGVTLQGNVTLAQSSVATITNNGSIVADNAGTFTIQPATFINNGQLVQSVGTMTLSGTTFTNTGTIQVTGGTLNLNNSGSWDNSGGSIPC